MNAISITPLYVAAIALLMAVLSTRVGILRGKHSVALGDGGITEMTLGIRRFGNLTEYAAVALLLLLLMEMIGISAFWLHAYGLALVAFRLIHPVILYDEMDVPLWKKIGRGISAGGTSLLLLIGGVVLVWNGVS